MVLDRAAQPRSLPELSLSIIAMAMWSTFTDIVGAAPSVLPSSVAQAMLLQYAAAAYHRPDFQGIHR